MKQIIHRFIAAIRIMFVERVYVIEVHKDQDRERIELWGPQMNDEVTVHIFRKLVESMEHDELTPDNKRAVSSHKINLN
jgi:hypothetical protein